MSRCLSGAGFFVTVIVIFFLHVYFAFGLGGDLDSKSLFSNLTFEIVFRPFFSFRVLGETLNVFHPSGRRDSGNYTCVVFNGVTNTSASFLVTAQGKDYKLGFSFCDFLCVLLP